MVSEKNPGLLTIAPNLYHGWKNIGATEAIVINMPDRMYDYEQPTRSTCRGIAKRRRA